MMKKNTEPNEKFEDAYLGYCELMIAMMFQLETAIIECQSACNAFEEVETSSNCLKKELKDKLDYLYSIDKQLSPICESVKSRVFNEKIYSPDDYSMIEHNDDWFFTDCFYNIVKKVQR